MSSSSEFDIDRINLEDITITGAGIDNKTDITSIDRENYYHDLSYNFLFAASPTAKRIRVTFSCSIKTYKFPEEEISLGGNFDIAYFFKIENFDELVKGEEEMKVNSDVVMSLANIAYSTSRGIIYTRCQGTILNNVILPILSTKKLREIL